MDQEAQVATFSAVTGADAEAGLFFMEMSGWNMEQAVSAFFDQGGVAAMPPRSEPVDVPPMDVVKEPMERAVSFVAGSYGAHLQKGLSKLLKAGLFADVTLNVMQEDHEPVRIPAHRFVLSMASGEFRDILWTNPKDTEDAMDEEGASNQVKEIDIEIGHISLRIFRLMLDYIYTGMTSFDEPDLLPLIELASKYRVVALREKCGEMLYSNDKDIASLMEIAAKYGCAKLGRLCAQYFARNWTKSSKDGTLLRLSPGMWEELLRCDEIEAYEEDIFASVIHYSQEQSYARADRVLEQLLPMIRFPMLDTRVLLEDVGKNPVLEILPITHELLHEAFRYKLYPTQYTKSDHRFRPRKGALRWSPTQKSGDIVVSENRMTASYRASAAANKWNTVLAENYVKAPGKHTFYIKVDHCGSGWMFIGVATKDWDGWRSTGTARRGRGASIATYIGNVAPSWSICSSAGWGKTAAGGTNVPYGAGFSTGNVVKMVLDMDERTLSYGTNGTDHGVAFTGLPDEVRVGVTLYGPGDRITIVQDYEQQLL